jgi:hypothetical protein
VSLSLGASRSAVKRVPIVEGRSGVHRIALTPMLV